MQQYLKTSRPSSARQTPSLQVYVSSAGLEQPHNVQVGPSASHAGYSPSFQYQPPTSAYLHAIEEHNTALHGLSSNTTYEDHMATALGGVRSPHHLQQQLSTGSSNYDARVSE